MVIHDYRTYSRKALALCRLYRDQARTAAFPALAFATRICLKGLQQEMADRRQQHMKETA